MPASLVGSKNSCSDEKVFKFERIITATRRRNKRQMCVNLYLCMLPIFRSAMQGFFRVVMCDMIFTF